VREVLETFLSLSVVDRCMNMCVRLYILHVFSGAIMKRFFRVFIIAHCSASACNPPPFSPPNISVMIHLKVWIFPVSRLYQHLLSDVVRMLHWLQEHDCRTIALPASYQTVALRAPSAALCADARRHFLQRNKCQTSHLPLCFLNSFVRMQTSKTHFFNLCSRTVRVLTEKHMRTC
jgi:hypothetical protein